MSLLGVDVGTTGCKAAAFSIHGKPLGESYREYGIVCPARGCAELDSRLVLERVWEVIAEVAARCAGDPVTAVCVSSIGEAMTPVSRDGEILGNCILHVDSRGGEEILELSKNVDPRRWYEINPNIIGTGYSLPKLLWLQRHARELYDRAWKFLCWSDLVAFELGCEPAISFSHANRTLLFDIRSEDWSPELLAVSGIDREKLPQCRPSGWVAGRVSATAASRLGLPRDVAVVVGGHDQCCNSLGAGVCAPGKAVCGIGTVECITPAYDSIPAGSLMMELGLNVEHHVLRGLYVSFIYNQSGALVRWFRDTFAPGEKGAGAYDRLAAEMPAGPTRLLALPYFEPSGAPRFVSDAAGVIAGLKMHTTRGEILKSLMESATFYFVDSIESLKKLGTDTSSFVATGGGAKSDAWLQIKADIMGVPFARPKITECSTLGAALLAGLATGAFADPQEAVDRFVSVERVFEPDPGRHEAYRELYAKYCRLYSATREVLREL